MEEKGIRQEERATATTDMGKEGITAQENRETGVSPAGKEKERRKREPEKPLTPKQLQQRRKLLAYPLMGLLFLGSMWLIFAPSDQRDRVQQGVGAFNAEIPLPQDEGILDDKRTAYEQAEMEQNRKQRVRPLEDFVPSEEDEPEGAGEPVAEIRRFVTEQNIPTTIMYDMAHVLGLVGDHFQKPFEEGAEIVTGSTHKTFFGPQRGVIGVNYRREDLKWGLWETIQSRAFPGSVSNHHLGTQLGLLMAAYEMNYFKDSYQKAVIDNAKYFAKALHEAGLHVLGDPAIGYTETHQVLVDVGYGTGPEVAERLEEDDIIVNYQATPDEEGFTASGALRMGVSEMTRFGFGQTEFTELAGLMADCILRGKDVGQEVSRLRSRYTTMHYCFDGPEFQTALEQFMGQIGF